MSRHSHLTQTHIPTSPISSEPSLVSLNMFRAVRRI
nr:MAG TPA: hypothetical protein [Caudoviricetes sp.]